MSEPMSAVEIEDVLSSIRRLVSDDLRPAAAPARSEPAAADAGKLILTPALRVVQNAPRPTEQAIEAVVAGLGAAVDAQAGEWEAETGDEPPQAVAPLAAPVDEAPHWDEAEDEAASWDDAEDTAVEQALAADRPFEFVAHPRLNLGAESRVAPAVAEPVAEAPAQAADWDMPEAPAAAPVAEVLTPPAAAQVPGWAQDDEGDEPAAEDRWSEATLEPDPEWADAAEAEALQELADTVTEAAPAAMLRSALTADPDAIDDAALRDLVRELIVEELQGPLGERITRNIRKLVRAEIARALAAEQLL